MLRILSICFALLLGTQAFAQEWPSRSVHLIVPYAAGGGTDTVARVLAQKLSNELGQQFVVENKPGASGMIGAALVAKSAPDGYTLLVASPAEIALNQNLFPTMTYDPLKDFSPITLLAWTPLVMAAHPDFPASTPQELVALAKKEQVDFSTPGIGSSHHLTGEYMNHVAGTKLMHVPYRGAAPAVTDAVAGQVKFTISGMPPVVPFLKAGKLKAIAVTSKKRFPLFPNVPAMSEVKGFEDFDFTNWFGLLAPAGTPKAILDKLQKASAEALKDEHVRQTLENQAAVAVGNTSEEFAKFIRDEAARYKKIVEITQVKIK
ncbi:MAG TPA: tripartite tricarboxylate transporter substrate binding protein [Xanthobacteraceae bacterium]|jgi:tripartite-type tricarboxylate transporter receptor subunit TctC|nr:tripartite tricarboxylate transporter substrate binding protein [Xanthobacteraceae bacterium]